jgi:hypothetical protein
MTGIKSGQVVYSSRAFEQDAEQAIQNNVIRALIELITNSDDAYQSESGGDIVIEINSVSPPEGYKFEISVRDRARGLTAEEMESKLTVLGGDNANFAADSKTRGLLGRGAKDVASLGAITFEGVRNGKYTTLTLDHLGKYALSPEVIVTNAILDRMGLAKGENGFTATAHAVQKVTLPKADSLQVKLQSHVQLRELLDRREVVLVDSRSKQKRVRLLPPDPVKNVILEKEIHIPDFDTIAKLRIEKLDVASTRPVDEYTLNGILIKSGVTIYQNSLFGREAHSQAPYITGVLECELINDLIREYDNGNATIENPNRLVSRTRDGLNKSHPFTKALFRAALTELDPIMETLVRENGVRTGEGENLNRAFRDIAQALKSEVSNLIKDIEDSDSGSSDEELELADISVVPPVIKLFTGSKQSLTVRVKTQFVSSMSVALSSEPEEDFLGLSVPNQNEWVKHERLDYVQTNFQIHASEKAGSCLLTVNVGGLSQIIPVNVIEPLPDAPIILPENLLFNQEKASIAPTRTRKLELVAPLSYIDRAVVITSKGTSVQDFPETLILRAEPENRWSRVFVPVKAGTEKGSVEITATLADGEFAFTTLNIDEHGPLGGLILEFHLRSGGATARRVNVLNPSGNIVIEVQGDHPAFHGVFGRWNDQENRFLGEDTPQARSVLSECLSRALAQHIASLQAAKHPEEFTDAERFYNRSDSLTSQFAKKFYAALGN